jgi:flavin-dependent dehydrogenase
MKAESEFDVLICGAGIAGLTLARQLRLELPELTVGIVDRLESPLPEASHKVGESSVELFTYYFGQKLGLDEYLEKRHLPKLGLRFFFGDPTGPFEERPELGPTLFPPIPSYQIDRGRVENDLREMAREMDVTLYEGAIVDDIVLSLHGDDHVVNCRKRAGGERFSLRCRWVVDALGRRRFLQSRLGLKRPNNHKGSAAWWRVDERLDVNDLALNPDDRWRRRNVEERFLSTNHLMGRGYWIWLIPLSSGATSVGIVTDERLHPFVSYGKSYQHALAWIGDKEPGLLRLLEGHEPLDFHGLKDYSYDSAQLFSHHRWSCVGEAGFFLDPLYSLGGDFIAVGNAVTVELIRRDLRGELDASVAKTFNQLILEELAPASLGFYEGTYATFGHGHIFTAKFTWDIAMYWTTLAPLAMQEHILRPSPELLEILKRFRRLNERVQKLFVDWASLVAPKGMSVELSDLTRMPLLQLLHFDLTANRSAAQFLNVTRKNLRLVEELAQVLFWQAVEECMPERLPAPGTPRPWLDAWRIGLDPDRWQADGLFQAQSEPRDLRRMEDNFAGIFEPMNLRQRLLIESRHWLIQLWGGFVNYRLVTFIHRTFFTGKSATWLRPFFVKE